MMPERNYDVFEVHIAPGESLLFYTDGLVEAHNPMREMFDIARLKTALAAHEEYVDGASLIDSMLGELRCFTGEAWEQEDDVTMMVVQRLEP